MTQLAAAASSSASVWAQPGTLGFLVVFGMCVVLFFVFRSMSRHLRKVRESARMEQEQADSSQSAADHDGSRPDALANGPASGRRSGSGFSPRG